MKFIQVECRLGCLGEINIKTCNSCIWCVFVYALQSSSKPEEDRLKKVTVRFLNFFYLPDVDVLCGMLCRLQVNNYFGINIKK